MSLFPHPEQLPERTPAGYIRVSDRSGSHLVRKDSTAPMLPAMPQMLPDDPTEAAVSASALKAMMTAHTADNEEVRAVGGMIRFLTVGAGLGLAATMAWGTGYLLRPADVTLEMLPAFWLAAVLLTVAYTLISESTGRRYSSAGVEHAKIRAAVEMHADRLNARREMHAAATEAWENVLTAYLDKEYRQ